MSYRVAQELNLQHNKRGLSDGSPTVVARADVTTTVYLGSTSTSGASSSTSVPIPAIAGGLAAGVIIVIVAVVFWRCCGRNDARSRSHRQRVHTQSSSSKTSLTKADWRPEDSFSQPQRKGASSPYSAMPTPLRLSQIPSGAVNVPLRPSASSDGSSRGSGDSSREPPKDEEADISTLPYDREPLDEKPLTLERTEASSPRSPPDEQLNSHPPRSSSRRKHSDQLREPPATATGTPGARRYAPARPSPLAQAAFRKSEFSPSGGPMPPPPAYDGQQSPTSPFRDASDPFLEGPPSAHRYYPDEEVARPMSGVGYAI